jgi:beta-galactosidase beta subunit
MNTQKQNGRYDIIPSNIFTNVIDYLSKVKEAA